MVDGGGEEWGRKVQVVCDDLKDVDSQHGDEVMHTTSGGPTTSLPPHMAKA